MPMSNFPNGFLNGLLLKGMPLLQLQPGNAIWVGNGPITSGGSSHNPIRRSAGADGNKGTFTNPLATLQAALNQCLQGNGDIICILPDHKEAISSATILALNCADVAIIGLGTGASRPTFTFTTATTANIQIRAANMSIQNCLFVCNFAAVASVFTAVTFSITASVAASASGGTGLMTVTAVGSGTIFPGMGLAGTGVVAGTKVLAQVSGTTGGVGTYTVDNPTVVASTTITGLTTDLNIENCEFRDLSSVLNFVSVFTGNATANSCDGFRFKSNRISSLGTTAATTAIIISSATDRMQLQDNYGNWAILNNVAALVALGANNATNLDVCRNVIQRPNTSTTGGLLISTSSTGCTGHVYDNYVEHLAATGLIIATGSKLAFSQNFAMLAGAADKSGSLNPAAI